MFHNITVLTLMIVCWEFGPRAFRLPGSGLRDLNLLLLNRIILLAVEPLMSLKYHLLEASFSCVYSSPATF